MSTTLAITDPLPLRNSTRSIPRLGFGVYRIHGKECVQATGAALKAGYRHIDTAQFYGNEKEVGEIVRTSGIPRDEVFMTTKIMTPAGSPEATYQKAVDSVDKIAGKDGYVDLFLIHSPSSGQTGRKQLWQALERLVEEGRAKSIGVSNYGIKHIEEMKAYAKIWPPDVNQIELHPWCQQPRIDRYCKANGIVIEAYCPLVRANKFNDPTLVGLAKKYEKSTAQILIRYSLQKGWVPLPKSSTPDRIISNADVYDFHISKEDMGILDSLDQGDAGVVVESVSDD
ncbi:putative aldo-keto reductase [Talaromyces proteolyticus]|uniref:D-xylose reductase [NAD(P)H] n=1 Tax=Talaromyces proteolyticus TaxID=1131652 RepID=A0AAD4KXY5_9EURO|nr:putative aldo-keto reductase [Talaromyces proteolyticus]KAH8702346.1 putative aldo-keto reductase [Talaromyces proteolyticus]